MNMLMLHLLYILILASCSDGFKLTSEKSEIKVHHKMTKREIHQIFGVDSHDKVPEYDVAVPHRADPISMDFLTYKLRDKEHERKRRSAEPNVWFYNIQALGLNLKLNLSITRNVIGPKVQIETIHKNGSKSYCPQPKKDMLEGHVLSKPGSFAVIDNNDGLTGMIKLQDQVLFVHPLPSHLAKDYGQQNGGGHAHVVYRHPSDDATNAKRSCHTEEPEQKKDYKRSRMRRSVDEHAPSSDAKKLEMAIIADKYLIESKDKMKIFDFLKMVAHIIDVMFQDASIGKRKIHVKVVKITLDEANELGIEPGDNSLERLNKLGSWGIKNDEQGNADVLVHITKGIVGGLARVKSTCYTQLGVTVSNDVGLATAIIAAHEIGHTMGVGHDGGSDDCPNYKYIMSTTLSSGRRIMTWSKCSRETLQRFLSSDDSSCLDNKPPQTKEVFGDLEDYNPLAIPAEYYKKLPGQIYNAAAQCELQYGKGYYRCPYEKSNCVSLLCTNVGSVCFGRSSPPMDGTRCGERHWCIKGECVDDGSPIIDGEWSKWSAYKPCSQSCGGGLKWRTRTCTNPKPDAGGSDCEGSKIGHYALCNTQDCPKGSKTFRQSQCDVKFPGSRVWWVESPCKLSCIRRSLIHYFGDAADGTRCYADKRRKDVCAQGTCLPAGCDSVLYSGVKHDHCGVCGGDSSSCKIVKSIYDKNWRRWGPSNADPFIYVPANSSNVNVKINELTTNLLGVKDLTGRYVYNVGRTWSTVVKTAGTKVNYDHEDRLYKDNIFIRGPTTQPLKIMYVSWGGKNPGVSYEFFVQVKSNVSAHDVYWNAAKWSLCTEQCAGGKETRAVQCLRKDDNSWVSDTVCEKISQKPEQERKCNEAPCSPSWYMSTWRPCSKTCGRGQQIREVLCREKIEQGVHRTVLDEKCSINDKPKGILEKDCNKIACNADWVTGNWSQCSATCGSDGKITRKLYCKRLNEEGEHLSVEKGFCDHAPKLPTTKSCNTDIECPVMFTAPNGKKFIPVGCFREGNFHKGERALPEMVANLRGKINWRNMTQTVEACSEAVSRSKFKVFGIQFYGECWSGQNADKTYAEYGFSKNCWNGVGGSKVNYIYTFV